MPRAAGAAHGARRGAPGRCATRCCARPPTCPTSRRSPRQLAVSERTLRRRLAEEGTSFRALADEVRETLAEELLTTGSLSVEEVGAAAGLRRDGELHARLHPVEGHVAAGVQPSTSASALSSCVGRLRPRAPRCASARRSGRGTCRRAGRRSPCPAALPARPAAPGRGRAGTAPASPALTSTPSATSPACEPLALDGQQRAPRSAAAATGPLREAGLERGEGERRHRPQRLRLAQPRDQVGGSASR